MIAAYDFTAEQFLELLREGDRWIELDAGRLVRRAAPDDAHGNVVRNVARSLAAHIRKRPDLVACFDLGLIVRRHPDTVRCPAISCFPLPAGFDESDKLITDTRPRIVMEVASTNDRRAAMAERVLEYLEWGVEGVWVFDPVDRQVRLFGVQRTQRVFQDDEVLQDAETLPDFRLPVSDAFADPKWLRPRRERS
jgi:Uma2 family endonuclease